MKEEIEALVSVAMQRLTEIRSSVANESEKLASVCSETERQIQALVDYAEQSEKLEVASEVCAIGIFEVPENSVMTPVNTFQVEMDVTTRRDRLRLSLVRSPGSCKPGRYRAVVLIDRIGDL